MEKTSSYTSANGFPIKLLKDVDLLKSINEREFIPLRHLQLCPTNRCNQSCEFCSCMDRDKKLELSLDEIKDVVTTAWLYGCKGITITGGGEPLLYSSLQQVIDYCIELKIKVGLVTNGIKLENMPNNVSWCRVSFDPNRTLPLNIEEVVKAHPEVDWAFSYVLYKESNNLREMVELANKLNFTHVRIVSDILNPDITLMDKAKKLLKGIDGRVIYQPRTNPTYGRKKCLISLLKPIIGADGKIYPCCGIQYAKRNILKDFNSDMGTDLNDIIVNQKYFDGSQCEVCYYDNYNFLLNSLLEKVNHLEWV